MNYIPPLFSLFCASLAFKIRVFQLIFRIDESIDMSWCQFIWRFVNGVSADQSQTTSAVSTQANGTTGWELALVTAPSSNESATAASKLVCFILQK